MHTGNGGVRANTERGAHGVAVAPSEARNGSGCEIGDELDDDGFECSDNRSAAGLEMDAIIPVYLAVGRSTLPG